MRVATEELRRVTLALLRHVEETGQTHFDITDDYYWDVPAVSRYAPYAQPEQLTVGQLSSDLSEVMRVANGDRVPVGYDLVWLAALLRYVGEKSVG